MAAAEVKKKRTERQWRSHWRKLVKDILESTPIDNNETDEERKERIAKLEAEPEEWFRYYFPRFAYAPAAQFHKDATKRILENREWYEVRLWSRELAKSTRTMMEVFYLTLVGHYSPAECFDNFSKVVKTGKKRCVLLISNSLDNATRLLMPYRANLEYNRRIIQDYGPQKHIGSWEASEFITQQGVSFRALGAGQSPRGTRNEEVRPDIIIFDDVDTDADCLNPEIIAKRWRWIEEAAIGTRSVSEPTTIIFCGNRIATDCCIERATRLADHVDEKNIRDAEGNSVWPEKNKEVDIDRVLSQKSYAAQQKEYFNNPLVEGSVFKEMAYKPAMPLSDYSQLVCYTDPSYKATNDYKATVLVGKWQQEYHVVKCFLDKATTAQMIEWIYRIMDMVGNVSCNYFMEEVFMQDVIRKEVSDAGIKTGRTIPIRGDTRRKGDKFTRIESLLEPLHRNGQLYLNADEQDNPHMQRLAEQFVACAAGSRAHDDGPDAVEGAVWQIGLRTGGIDGIVSVSRPVNDKRY
jgi:predicted phage terminase large subunit-like protein